MMGQYRRLCKGIRDKGVLIPADQDVYKFAGDRDTSDYYTSLYKYNEKHKEIFDKTGSVAGITDTTTDSLLWDFDNKDDFEAVRADTLTLVNRLKAKGISEEQIAIYFSGNKGTHVEVKIDKDITVDEFKATVFKLADGLRTYDGSVSNASRLIRLPNSKHISSGLYKTEITPDELQKFDLDRIKELSKEPYDPAEPLPSVSSSNLVIQPEKPKTAPKSDLGGELNLDYSQKPKWLSHWKYALLNGYFPEGTRNFALMILAATYKGQGMPETVTYHALKGAAELQSNRFNTDKYSKDEIYLNIIKRVYSETWAGGTYAEDSFPKPLQDYLTELGVPRKAEADVQEQMIETIDEGYEGFIKYAEEIEKNTMRFGIRELDEKLQIRKGHMIGLVAPPGVGKTSLAVAILNNMSKQGTHCYFGSYDMYKNNVYQRLIQRHTAKHQNEIFQAYIDKDVEQINKWRKLLNENYKNVSFCYKAGQSIQELQDSVRLTEEKVGKNIDLVVVDYLELIRTSTSDPTAASMEAIQGLREIANEGRVVFVLLQPNKMSSKVNEPLTSYNAAKGSSAIAQACTAILTAHRPGLSSEYPEEDNYFSINCVKNRNGPLFALDFGWVGRKQVITNLSDIEKQELAELRERIKLRNSNIEGDRF
jgi:KaiC/GvpD/RAD55 family RecA-like ATPase